MSNYADLLARAEELVQDQVDLLSADAKKQAFREALVRYEQDRPREAIEDFDGDGSAYQFTFAGGFVDGYSRIVRVEYPVGERPPAYLSFGDYSVYRASTDSAALYLGGYAPATGEQVRVTYTLPHAIEGLDDATATTVLARHEEALVTLAASRMLARLASLWLGETDSTIDADGINRNTKDERAAKRSRALEQDYRALLDVRAGITPAVVISGGDARARGSLPLLTHARGY